MHKRTAAVLLTGALAAGTVGAVVITPASASTSSNPISSRLALIKDALKGLVGDGTLTQAQADKVASTLNNKLPQGGLGGGPGHRLGAMVGLRESMDAVASALRLTPAELMTKLRSGQTLAQIAKAQGVTTDALVKAMVAAAEKQLTAAVQNNRLTQQQADTIKSTLTQRMTDLVNGTLPKRGPGFGGPGRWGGPGTAPQAPGSSYGTPSGTTPGTAGPSVTTA
jgi:hypothetical protein